MHPEQQQVYWYSGLYLQPQHLQSLDLHHTYMLSQQRQVSQPWNVGILHCEINYDTLVDFSLNIDRLQLILPSGIYLEYPGNCIIESRQFRDIWRKREKPFTLWLVLRRFDPNHQNVSAGSNSRWISTVPDTEMKDIYHSGPECAVSRIIYNVRILSDEEVESAVDSECIRFIRLRYDNDRVIYDPTFSPPAVTLSGTPSLRKILDGLYAELSSRARTLEEYKRPGLLSIGSRNPVDTNQLLVMRTLNRIVPLFGHYLRTPMIHPWQIYGILVQLIGELSSFNDMCSFSGEWLDGGSPVLPYDHLSLFDSFNSVKQTLLSLLNGLALEDTVYIKLIRDNQGAYIGDLKTHEFSNASTVLLLLQTNKPPVLSDNSSLNGEFKISTQEDLRTLVSHSLPGLSSHLITPSPRGVPNREDFYYFSIDKNDPVWRSIEKNRNIAFYWAEAPDDLQVQLVFMES
ncbi:type VI secretion protein, VC_A0114 family (plasmid) [Enterobacter soli]|uniref:type VI secretion system baseplate subunit TssK n=1 Tax=Enterobacter soli TaxID=885040 RepID=UPI000223CFED|nr:type VI secretion system baseplate subunit TssK [Enterobacter soli]AEN67296.1 type VI secretion protein, VC_A0114 family [Enterobacter soli]OAT35217.1 ImpJ/VasE family protein [Enterobacter soli ATCC BAA-2102]